MVICCVFVCCINFVLPKHLKHLHENREVLATAAVATADDAVYGQAEFVGTFELFGHVIYFINV